MRRVISPGWPPWPLGAACAPWSGAATASRISPAPTPSTAGAAPAAHGSSSTAGGRAGSPPLRTRALLLRDDSPGAYPASMARLGRKTGPKPGFTRDDVIAAALEIGVDSFTMAQVAARLGVRPSALYRTVASRDDVVAACLERIGAGIRLPRGGQPWEDYLRGVVEAMWKALEEHPGLDRTLMSLPWTNLHLLRTAQCAHGELVAAGMDPREAYFALDVVIDTTVATHQAVAALRAPAQEGLGAGGRDGRGQPRPWTAVGRSMGASSCGDSTSWPTTGSG